MTTTHRPLRPTGRRLATGLAVLSMVGAAQISGITPAEASTGTGTPAVTTQRMSGPALTSTQEGTYAAGKRLTLTCHVRGQSVTGHFSSSTPGGSSNLWYRVSDGRYVADIDLLTGSNDPVASKCADTKAQAAVTWANGQVGSQSYGFACQLFVENAYGTSGRFASAIAAYNSLRAAGAVRTSGQAPAGALVFSKSPADQGYGHVMISRGDGTYVSGGADGPSVKVFTTPTGVGGTYLGWAPAPSSWPGR